MRITLPSGWKIAYGSFSRELVELSKLHGAMAELEELRAPVTIDEEDTLGMMAMPAKVRLLGARWTTPLSWMNEVDRCYVSPRHDTLSSSWNCSFNEV